MSDVRIGVLLPARLETRFIEPEGVDEHGQPVRHWRLKIAVIPDEPWMNRHSELVGNDEADCVAALWTTCRHDTNVLRSTDEGKTAFGLLARQVGAARAWWLVTHFGPHDPLPTGQKRVSRLDGLPDRIEIWLGLRRGVDVALQRLEPPLSIDRNALGFEVADEDEDVRGGVFDLFEGGRWWTKDAGLQGEYELPFTDESQLGQIEVIMAVGLGEHRPQELFESHRNAGLLSLLPLGTPTNTVTGEPAADLARDPDVWWRLLGQREEAESRTDLASALVGDATRLEVVPGGTRGHRTLDEQVVTALWPALWGHTLKDVWCVDRALDWRGFSFELGLWAQRLLHPEGPLAPMRIGEQPYGVWPVTRMGEGAWRAAEDDPAVERGWLADWLPTTRRRWAAGARGNSGTVAGTDDAAGSGADGERVVRLLGRVPTGSDYGARTFLPIQMMHVLSSSVLGGAHVQDADTWLASVREKTDSASEQLRYPIRPIRRYVTTGWRQDLPLPLVEPPPAIDPGAGFVPGWTHLAATADGGVLFYDARSGKAATAWLDREGTYRFVGPLADAGTGWTVIASAHRRGLLFYRAATHPGRTGDGATALLDGTGTYRSATSISGFNAAWTHVVGTPSGGVLFYDDATGVGATVVVDAAGRYHFVGQVTFTAGWTHIVATGGGGLLFYNAASGAGATARLDGAGGYRFVRSVPGFDRGWTHVVAANQDGLLFYEATSGLGATARLDGAGNYQFVGTVAGLDPGWTHIVGTTGGGLLFYDAETGAGATGTLDAAGTFSAEPLAEAVRGGGSAFFTQLDQLLERCDAGPFARSLFPWGRGMCEPWLRSDSLLMRLLLHSIALLHAEMGRMRELGPDHDGLPLVENFSGRGDAYCTDVQGWCHAAAELSFEHILDDAAVCDFFGLDAGCLDGEGERPVVAQLVHVYRGLIRTLHAWRDAYHEALHRVHDGDEEAVRRLLADTDRAFRATLDAACLRIDPWVTGMAWRRLQKLRHEGRSDGLGLYGWVDRPYRGTPGPTAGGTLLAPAHAQLLTSVILRDKRINEPTGERWRIELDSRTVRQAKRFADEVRAGAHIQEVLGRAVEGIVGNADHIERLRKRFQIRTEHAGRRVCDGQQVLETEDGTAFLAELALKEAQLTALDDLRAVKDSYGDLLVANAVHAVVEGRPERAGESMDAAAGLELPPEFDLLRTPHSGDTVDTTVWMALPAAEPPDPYDPDASPAMIADAAVATYLQQAVPTDEWRWIVRSATGTHAVALTDLGLSVPEALAFHDDALRHLAVLHAGGDADGETGAAVAPESPAVHAYRRLRRRAALLAGHMRQEHADELHARLQSLLAAARALSHALGRQGNGHEALRRARRWGIAPAPLDDSEAPEEHRLTAEAQLALRLREARQLLHARIALAEPLGSDAPAHQLAEAISNLSGSALPIFGRTARGPLEAHGPLAPHATLDQAWLETIAAVRPALARVEAHQLGSEPPLRAWCNHQDPWTFVPDADAPVKRPMNVVVCYGPAATLGAELAVAVLDSWSEMIPARRHIVEAAIGFNAPSSRAPQVVLLAVPPDESSPLDTETLAHIVLEARESAHARMATPDDVEPFAALFPHSMIAASPPTGVHLRPLEPA